MSSVPVVQEPTALGPTGVHFGWGQAGAGLFLTAAGRGGSNLPGHLGTCWEPQVRNGGRKGAKCTAPGTRDGGINYLWVAQHHPQPLSEQWAPRWYDISNCSHGLHPLAQQFFPTRGKHRLFYKKNPHKIKKKKSENAQTTNVALSLLNLYPKLHLPFAGSAPILRAWVEIAQLQTLISKQEKWHRAELCSRPMLCTLASSTHTPGYNNDLL